MLEFARSIGKYRQVKICPLPEDLQGLPSAGNCYLFRPLVIIMRLSSSHFPLGRYLNGYAIIRFPIENCINYFSVNHVPTPYELCSFFPGEMQIPYLG